MEMTPARAAAGGNTRARGGFTLAEALVASAILGVVVSGTSILLARSVRASPQGVARSRAYRVLNEMMQQPRFRARSYDLPELDIGKDKPLPPVTIAGAETKGRPDDDVVAACSYRVQRELVSVDGTPVPAKRIRLRLRWSAGGAPDSAILETLVTLTGAD